MDTQHMQQKTSQSQSGGRATLADIEESKIREVANAGMGLTDLLAFWFGEPDQVTPEFIRDAAKHALDTGATFYTQNLGIPPLREAIAKYVSALHRPTDSSRIAVTSSGVSALMLVYQALFDPGDRVVIITPVWPNVTEGPKILGAAVTRVPLHYEHGWKLDLARLLAALTPQTRAVIINSPNNPTGWTMDRDAQEIVLAHCRKHGIWIIADDVYERLYFGSNATCAPSFLDLAHQDDLVVSTNSFSKSWLMTGWRLGWIVAPPLLTEEFAKLIEYNTSCAPSFVQQAGIVALEQGESVTREFLQRLKKARDFLVGKLSAVPEVRVAAPPGAMYLFLGVEGVVDSVSFAKQLVREQKLGLAPGVAFGVEGEGYLRWCFASSIERLEDGVGRFQKGLAALNK
jgi:aspartate/methionine/tyrosine aminotransferase